MLDTFWICQNSNPRLILILFFQLILSFCSGEIGKTVLDEFQGVLKQGDSNHVGITANFLLHFCWDTFLLDMAADGQRTDSTYIFVVDKAAMTYDLVPQKKTSEIHVERKWHFTRGTFRCGRDLIKIAPAMTNQMNKQAQFWSAAAGADVNLWISFVKPLWCAHQGEGHIFCWQQKLQKTRRWKYFLVEIKHKQEFDTKSQVFLQPAVPPCMGWVGLREYGLLSDGENNGVVRQLHQGSFSVSARSRTRTWTSPLLRVANEKWFGNVFFQLRFPIWSCEKHPFIRSTALCGKQAEKANSLPLTQFGVMQTEREVLQQT